MPALLWLKELIASILQSKTNSFSDYILQKFQLPKTQPKNMLSTVKIVALLGLFGVSQAADCNGGMAVACSINDGALGRVSDMWAARQNYCGNNMWKTTSCYKYKPSGPESPIWIYNSKPGANNQQICWDALEDIINRKSRMC